ncbi:hypothetical protein [Pontibacillus salipaludis]|uniref:hypothetical protein n=1 Tax=Pontibacillus salipaludis TaxID=1697394 RepID=UPI0031E5CC05
MAKNKVVVGVVTLCMVLVAGLLVISSDSVFGLEGSKRVAMKEGNTKVTNGSDEKEVIKVKAGLNKFDNEHLPKNFTSSVGEIFDKDFNHMNKDNSKFNLTLKLTDESSDEFDKNVEINGSIKIGKRSYGFKGEGEAISTEFEGETYYRVKYNGTFQGVNLKKENKNGNKLNLDNKNTGGIIIVNAKNNEIFKSSVSVGYANHTAMLFFGDDNKVTHLVDKKVIEELKGNSMQRKGQ